MIGSTPIKKASLNFVGKFWWAKVRFRLFPTLADNIMTLNNAILIENIMERYDINILRYIIAEIHEQVFQDSTSIPFPCLIDILRRDSSV